MVIAALIQHQPNLVLGNVIGASISNIFGAFSLGLLFNPGVTRFDAGSKMYSTMLLLTTTFLTALALSSVSGRPIGIILILAFCVYVVSVVWSIYRRIMTAPAELDTESDGGDSANEEPARTSDPSETTPLINESSTSAERHSIFHHICMLLLGFFALCLAGYVLSHSASFMADAFRVSSMVIGLTILSFATTLPEKFVAVYGGSRGPSGIVVANTAGSNVFLLALCMRVVLVGARQDSINKRDLKVFDLGVMWGSAVLITGIVLLGSRRWMGAVLLALYIAFLILEFTLFRCP